MRIRSISTLPVTNPRPMVGGPLWVFVRVETDEGLVGYGELFANALAWRPWRISQLVDELGTDLLIGHDVYDTEALSWKIYNCRYSHVSDMTKAAAASGIEMACWDIIGNAQGVPVYKLFGGKMRDVIRSYSYLYPTEESGQELGKFWQNPELASERALNYMDMGFTAIKLDPVPSLNDFNNHSGQVVPVQLSLEALDRAEATVAALRDVVGNRCDLIVGTHGQMSPAGAIRLAKRLEPYEPLWLEEPVPPELADEMAKVARATTIPITAGERLTSKWEFARLARADAVAIFNLDVSVVGGLQEAQKIAALAEANYIQVSPHVYGGPLVAAASIQLSLCLPNFLILEVNETYDGIYRELLDVPIEWRRGWITPSERPGLGHSLNEEIARSLAPEWHTDRSRRGPV